MGLNAVASETGLAICNDGVANRNFSVIVNYNTSSPSPDWTMKKKIAQFLNEIISITIMLLMAFALIAGQMNGGGLVNETGAGKTAAIVTVDIE